MSIGQNRIDELNRLLSERRAAADHESARREEYQAASDAYKMACMFSKEIAEKIQRAFDSIMRDEEE